MSLTIFNVVVYAVVRHLVEVTAESADEQSRHRQEGMQKISLFYAYDGMVASSDLRWIQGEFRTLAELFNSVDLETKVGKTVRMVCRLFQAAGTQSETAYRQHITCAGPSYRERQRVWVQCAECGEEMALGFLAVHRQTQHGKTTGGRRHW